MNISLVRTWTGRDSSHRTLQVITQRWYVLAWPHAFERGWWIADGSMLCFGCGWISFNFFNTKRA